MQYKMISTNYAVFITIVLMVLFTVILPDFSHRINKTGELHEMKKVLNEMTEQIVDAEAACYTAAEELCVLHYSMRDEETNTLEKSRHIFDCARVRLQAEKSDPEQVETENPLSRQIHLSDGNISKEKAIRFVQYTDSFVVQKPLLLTKSV